MAKKPLKPTTLLYPLPVVLVSCGTLEKPNIITVAWTGVICSEPPMVSIAIRPSRYSLGLIRDRGNFVINIPTVEQLEKVDHCGTVSGREVDKFAACGFTASSGTHVSAPLIDECPINLECQVRQSITLGTHELFLGEIVAIHRDETVVNDKGRVDMAQAQPIAFATRGYYRVGEYLNTYGFSRGQLSGTANKR